MKKRRILIAICVCLLISMALIVTIAYGTGSDNVNATKVDIDQVIYQSDSVLDPSVKKTYINGYETWSGIETLNNLTVRVKNEKTSADSVYIRTIFAFESGKLSVDEFHDLLCININTSDWMWPDNDNWEQIEIGEEKYFMATAVYNNAVAPEGITSSSLKGIGMDWDADYNGLEAAGFGDGLTIKTYSQAVQCSGFEGKSITDVFKETYGEVTVGKNPWNVVYVSTWAELVEALNEGKNVVLIDDISGDFGSLVIN